MASNPTTARPPGTVRLHGEYDVARVRELSEQLVPGVGHVLRVDASAVSFIDSSGLAVLLDAARASRRLGGAVVLVDASPAVRSLLDLTGTTSTFGL